MDQIYEVCLETLKSFGFSEEDSKYGAEVLYESDLRGVESHGIARLQFYADFLRTGMINRDAELELVSETRSMAYMNGHDGLGIVQAPRAMDLAIEKARNEGIGLVSVTHAGHFGIAGYYALKAARQDMIGFAIANAVPIVAAYGGKGAVMGNSPFSIAFPKGDDGREPTMIDAACSVVAGGKIEIQIRKGEQLPLGWCVDKDGNDTTDPWAILKDGGALLPFGGIKGYCLNTMFEMLAAVLPGAATGVDVGYPALNQHPHEDIGYFFLAIDPSRLRPLVDLKKDIGYFNDKLKSTPPKEGLPEVFLPGEIEFRNVKKIEEKGVDLNINVVKDLLRIGIEYGRLPADATLDDVFK
jgi:LDH2 family malate/lactate/ureidoglycolate dehydrogenase